MLISKISEIDIDPVDIKNFSVKLFDYQLAVIKRMKLYEKMNFNLPVKEYTEGRNYKKDIIVNVNTNVGILGDRNGTGKTLCVLGLINDTIDKRIEYKHREMNNIRSYIDNPPRGEYIDTTIIFYEKNTKDHWLKEVKKAGIRYRFIDHIVDDIEEYEYKLYDVILVTYNLASTVKASKYTFPYVFKRTVIDNTRCTNIVLHNIRTYFTWYVTDDYDSLCRNSKYIELKKIKDIEILVVKCKSSMYNNNKDIDINYKDVLCRNDEKTRFTRRDIECVRYLIDNLCYDDIIRYIGGEFYTKEQIIDGLRHEKTMQLQCRELKLLDIEGSNNIVRFINNRIPVIQNILEHVDSQTCCICLEDVNHPVLLKCCYNVYCNTCIVSELITNRSRCPNCKNSRMGVVSLCDSPVPRIKLKYEKLLDITENLPVESKFLIISNDINTNLCIKNDSTKSIEVLKTNTSILIDKFNKHTIDGLVIKDINKIRGIPFDNVTDIFFMYNMKHKDRKRLIYTAMNTLNTHINVYDLSCFRVDLPI